MFNELDDEMARSVCVIGTDTRDELWAAPERTGEEINPVGQIVFINNLPFTIIGMFQRYESESDHKARELAKAQAASKKAGAVARNRGRGGRGGSGGGFGFKNRTGYLPPNTGWQKFSSGRYVSSFTGRV